MWLVGQKIWSFQGKKKRVLVFKYIAVGMGISLPRSRLVLSVSQSRLQLLAKSFMS